MAKEVVSVELGGKTLSIETGRMAKQAAGSVLVTYGDTVVLVAVTAATKLREGQDFFPLTVDYREKTYAAGKIPGGFFKREGKQKDSETLTSRLIDRPLRPLFPKGFLFEVQVSCIVLSADCENPSDIPAMIGASAALGLSDVPFGGPIAGVRIGRVGGEMIVNPTFAQIAEGDMDIIVAANKESIMMIEGGSKFISEEEFLDAMDLAHAEIKKIIAAQEELQGKAGKAKREFALKTVNEDVAKATREFIGDKMKTAVNNPDKLARQEEVSQVKADAVAALEEKFADFVGDIKTTAEDMEVEIVRGMIANEGKRPDGRAMDEIRPITIETSVLPRTHGTALFTRGQTQALAVTTLGGKKDEKLMEELDATTWANYYLHYNFPSFSVGETKPNRGPGRREIGHGMLAQKAIQPTLPNGDDFPYTIRVVSEILESNGSSSMASVCGGSLSLMDAGVPVSAPVAGIAMGLIKEGDKFSVLTDIQGLEDHFGDMDFKVAGSKDGITAIQMDIKIDGLSREIMTKALSQAKDARMFILGEMGKVLDAPREEMSEYAPRVETIRINPEKIGQLIGPGGKNIRGIQEQTGADVNVEEDGTVKVASADAASLAAAVQMVKDSTAEAEEGKTYLGKVAKVMDFGAFVTIFPGTDGLCHISQLAEERVEKVEDVVREGDEILVKCIGVESNGKIRLSRKEALADRKAAQQ